MAERNEENGQSKHFQVKHTYDIGNYGPPACYFATARDALQKYDEILSSDRHRRDRVVVMDLMNDRVLAEHPPRERRKRRRRR